MIPAFRSACKYTADMSPAPDSPGSRPSRAFTIVEIVCSLFILAIAAGVCAAIFANRASRYDRTEALSGAPAAIDALSHYFDNEAGVDATNAAIVRGGAEKVVYRVRENDASLWQVADADTFASMADVTGPVYTALLANPKLYPNSSAVEFDVSLAWVAPGEAAESTGAIRSRLAKANALCKYRAIVLRR